MDQESAATERSSSETRSEAAGAARACCGCERSESSGGNRIPAIVAGKDVEEETPRVESERHRARKRGNFQRNVRKMEDLVDVQRPGSIPFTTLSDLADVNI